MVFLSLPTNFFVASCSSMACNYTSSCQIQFYTFLFSSLSVSVFLGVHPHWGLWRWFFFIHCNASKDSLHNVGSFILGVHPEGHYFDLHMADSIQIGGRSGSALRTRSPERTRSLDLLLSTRRRGLSHPKIFQILECGN
jgi:hypothetical protein